MKVLALEPYYGGSHRAFLDGWRERSRHEWSLLTLPPYKWKWRMRQAAVDFARRLRRRAEWGERWDVVFASDMVNLAEFRGLAHATVRELPAVLYFHENQITYPVRFEQERDLHFGLTNLWSAAAAREIWFNSAYHRRELLAAAPAFLTKMPDGRPEHVLERLAERSRVEWPGVAMEAPSRPRPAGPLRILWAARWEHDKRPEVFFDAVDRLAVRGVDFRLAVLGESFRDAPPAFAAARERHEGRIEAWGWLERDEYVTELARADVYVSTAAHEFFGLAAVEALAAGAHPVLPEALAYPELLELEAHPERRTYLYRDGAAALAERLEALAELKAAGQDLFALAGEARRAIARFDWRRRAPALDAALEALVETPATVEFERTNPDDREGALP